eukprot:gene32148-38887_t
MYFVFICLITSVLASAWSFRAFPNGISVGRHSPLVLPLSTKLSCQAEHNDAENPRVAVHDDSSQESGEEELTSPEIRRLLAKIADVEKQIEAVATETDNERKLLEQLNEQYGDEIARVKKEFSRMKERSYEESVEVSNKAKMDALKEVLPITDNYYRAKQLFSTISSDKEAKIIQ